MGGFYLVEDGDDMKPTIVDGYRVAVLYTLGHLKCMPKISTADTEDKEKSTFVVKTLVLAQFFWLVASLITRKFEGLPSSQLEFVSLAFACCSVLTYFAAWRRPKEVGTPMELEIVPGTNPLQNHERRHPPQHVRYQTITIRTMEMNL